MKVAIVGGTGYTGGELLRLLSFHPSAEVVAITSRSRMGEFAYSAHPNLRGVTDLQFVAPDSVPDSDVIFLCLPHGEASKQIDHWSTKAERIIDLSADFRIRDLSLYEAWYGGGHEAADWVSKFVYGLPEVSRADLVGARFASGVGCNATATNLALLPLVKAGLIDFSLPTISDLKVGSSEGGASATEASHHPERSGAVRSYAPAGHRHTAEVVQTLDRFGVAGPNLHLTVTSIEMVRGVLATVHAFLKEPMTEKDMWKAYRAAVKDEPFLRIVKAATGIFRAPEPKILAGSNFADLGFALSTDGRKVTALCAIDNLMKGAAGSAVQCMNLMVGFPEKAGLEFPGLHP